MSDVDKTKDLLANVRARIDSYNKFKKLYNEQLAFDFNSLSLFKINENNMSRIIAFFLDKNESHGQGDKFLKVFVEFIKEIIDESGKDNTIKFDKLNYDNCYVKCEKIIDNDRRLDIYIEFDDFAFSIENKIDAGDQENQIKDYSSYLKKEYKENYCLLYLTPDGHKPSTYSIDEKTRDKLEKNNRLIIIDYGEHILPLLDRWIVICKAPNVESFLKELKKYIERKILGVNSMESVKNLEDIILENRETVEELVSSYEALEQKFVQKLRDVKKYFDEKFKDSYFEGFDINRENLGRYDGKDMFKYGISKGDNKVWFEYTLEKFDFYINYYWTDETNENFVEFLNDNLGLKENGFSDYKFKIDITKDVDTIFDICSEKFELLGEVFKKYKEN